MDFHPIANLFPLMTEQEMDLLVSDIYAHGQKDPALIFEGAILDGRNRALACERLGRKLKTKPFNGSRQEALEHVWSTNTVRRHLTSSQKAMITAERKVTDPDFAEQCELMEEEAKERQKAGKKNLVETIPQGSAHDRKTSTVLAKASGTNRKYLELAEQIFDDHPEYVEPIKRGEKTVPQAKREITKAEKLARVAELPADKYRVIYADPPWSYNDKQAGEISLNYGGAEKHYPSMSVKELCELGVKGLAADDSVLFLWTTSPLLEDSFKIVNAWGFKYKASFVWDKVRHNMGHYNSVRHEFLLVCTRGSCTPEVAKLFDSVVSVERTDKHSEKPEEFREIIDTLYPSGKRIELFARTEVDGWDQWGAEA